MKWTPIDFHVRTLDELRRQPPHEVLGVPADASDADVKAAYRRKVRIYHPDFVDPFLKPHGEEVMKLLNRAYDDMLARGHK
ncbi:MAG TPA: DnaJ domain-containing protein [Vicinamibacterales bacterium]|jgi:DnaJ-class molecular chaperone|nr:DnaJ domain-containing protein [Vicinamibacterales bacterium]